MLDDRMQCTPGDEVWLVGERRSTGVAKQPPCRTCAADATIMMLAAATKARWICGQAHRADEGGIWVFDHFEGRSWTGITPTCLSTTMIAYAPPFNPAASKSSGTEKNNRKDRHHSLSMPAIRQAILDLLPVPASTPGNALTVKRS